MGVTTRISLALFQKDYSTPLPERVGKVLYLYTTSIKRSRETIVKVKVQVDLTKARPQYVWIGLNNDDLTIRKWQQVESEFFPPYYEDRRHQGHNKE